MFNFEKLSTAAELQFFSQFFFFWLILIENTIRILPATIATLHHPVMILRGHQTLLMHLPIE